MQNTTDKKQESSSQDPGEGFTKEVSIFQISHVLSGTMGIYAEGKTVTEQCQNILAALEAALAQSEFAKINVRDGLVFLPSATDDAVRASLCEDVDSCWETFFGEHKPKKNYLYGELPSGIKVTIKFWIKP